MGLFWLTLWLPLTRALHIRGTWESGAEGPLLVLAKFGFQQTDALNLEHTRGYIYGNVTSEGSQRLP